MRPHGSFSCWMYGQAGGNPANGCRCALCKACHSRHRYRTTPRIKGPAIPARQAVPKGGEEWSHRTASRAREQPPRPVADSAELTWRTKAACARPDIPTGIFYPSTIRTQHTPDITTALTICDGCPVTTDCLAYALEHDEPGIWGGTTPADRHLIIQQRQAG